MVSLQGTKQVGLVFVFFFFFSGSVTINAEEEGASLCKH